ncbi:helix-turn-helix domain-containing protein [Xanthobacter sp. DSM 24535]|uniref:IclR family transcriptional regulator n=1 Tax=Roseixanthobacter psychrophilus TaxID=3119917 RepID=UPI00372B849E
MPRGRPVGSGARKAERAASAEGPDKHANTLQTLDRGLQALTLVSQQESGISVAELAARLDVHRAIAYRLAATLEAHGLVSRGPDGELRLGADVLSLAARFAPQMRTLAQPLLRELAQATRATAFLSVPEGACCVAILVCEAEDTLLRVAYRIGSRHPLVHGAAGIAILSGRPPSEGEPEAVSIARRDGYSVTRGELQRGAVGVASPLHRPLDAPGGMETSVGVVALDDLDVPRATGLVVTCARRLSALMLGKA